MSHALMIQDWLTLTAPAAATTIIQNESSWLNVAGYADACFYLEVPQLTAGVTGNLYLQTSPTKDSSFFDGFVSGSSPGYLVTYTLAGILTAGLGMQKLQIARWADASPIQTMARFLRWKLAFTSATAASMTFRIWATMNQANYK